MFTYDVKNSNRTDYIYFSFICRRLFLEEQKGSHKFTGGTGYIVYIDQYILKEVKRKREKI